VIRPLLIGATALCAATVAAGAAAGTRDAARPVDLLPDLDQQTPTALRVANVSNHGAPHYVLGFQSAVRNIGAGPLIIRGERKDRSTPAMTAYQLVDRSDGSPRTVRTGDRLRYAISRTHQHWHLLHFDRYELRPTATAHAAALVRDQKTGFCLGDRYKAAGVDVPTAKPEPTWVGGCALHHPGRLSVEEGISPGYGDNYLPYLEGQSLPLTGLAAGRYVLVHIANGDHTLRESNYANNAASVLIDLRWDGKRPVLTELAECRDSATCDTPLQASPSATLSAKKRPVHRGLVATTPVRYHAALPW
jgi:Lysyl oxidase